jgi:muramoyltetrapeptide carboxypeptidase LdcA involved in peptidoglycan recycling
LLERIDWDLIRHNPKVFAGFSDITVLNNAIFARTGLVTYAAPNFYTFGLPPVADYSAEYFRQCLMNDAPIEVRSSEIWYDYPWQYDDSSPRQALVNDGPRMLNAGRAEGTAVGGNLCSFSLLNGTDYFPRIDDDIILTIEDDSYDSVPVTFERNLQSAIQQPYFKQVKGILVGRFQNESQFKTEFLEDIMRSQLALAHMPVFYNLNFGHTDPKFTYPIGGKIKMDVKDNLPQVTITAH